jgi:hypothetical protein
MTKKEAGMTKKEAGVANEKRGGRMEGSTQKRYKGVTAQVWSPTSLDRKHYSISKVRLPAGLNNRLPADVVLSIVLVFYTCQEENVTIFVHRKPKLYSPPFFTDMLL